MKRGKSRAPKLMAEAVAIDLRVTISEVLFGYFLFQRESDNMPTHFRGRLFHRPCTSLKAAKSVVGAYRLGRENASLNVCRITSGSS